MPIELLIHTSDHKKALKGTIQTVREVSALDSSPWGRKEGLPNYVRIRIIDAVSADVNQFLDPIKNKFTFTLITDTGPSRIYDIRVNPKTLALFGTDKGVTLDILVVLDSLGRYQLTFVDRELDNSRLRVEIQNTDFRGFFDDVLDKFEQVVATRRFRVDSADVDAAILNGGTLERTLIQITSRVIDRLA